jgi:hypothetical protein
MENERHAGEKFVSGLELRLLETSGNGLNPHTTLWERVPEEG